MIPKVEDALSLLSRGFLPTLFAEPHSPYTIAAVSYPTLVTLELHVFVEQQMSDVEKPLSDPADSWADNCNREIWDFLERQAERHKIDSTM